MFKVSRLRTVVGPHWPWALSILPPTPPCSYATDYHKITTECESSVVA
jgi:hypothetical protein